MIIFIDQVILVAISTTEWGDYIKVKHTSTLILPINYLLEEPYEIVSHDKVAEYANPEAKSWAEDNLIKTMDATKISSCRHCNSPKEAKHKPKPICSSFMINGVMIVVESDGSSMEYV